MRRMLFEKTGTAIWMSHLDTMRLMQRAFRRAGVLLHHSQGFTPHAYVSLPLPLSVGMESLCEIMEYEIDEELNITAEGMNKVMPAGVRVLAVYESSVKAKHITYLQAELRLFYENGVPENAANDIAALLSGETLMVEKRSKRGIEETDIRPLIRNCELVHREKELKLVCTVCAQNPSLNPQLIVTAIETHLPQHKPDYFRCRRLEIFDEEGKVFR